MQLEEGGIIYLCMENLKAISYLLQNLFRAHDLVAAQQLTPVTSLPDEAFEQYPMQTYGEDSVRIVQLQKTNEPLVRSL